MPTLLAIPSPPPSWASFQLGPLTIRAYALCILAGIAVAVVITRRRLAARGTDPALALDAALWAVPLGIVAARIYHVLTHTSDYFYPGANLWAVVAIWDGGNAIYGGLIGGTIGAAIACRRAGVPLGRFADALAPALLVAQAIGRLGNWFNRELFGLPTTLPWGLEIPSTNPAYPVGAPPGLLFHPLFLYELLWNLAGAGLLVLASRWLDTRPGREGRLFGLYLVWYGSGRAWFETIRIDPSSDRFLGIPANDWASILAVVLGVVVFAVLSRGRPGGEAARLEAPVSSQPADR